MTRQIVKRPQAERDIEECFVYIAEDNFEIGVDFLAAVEESLDQLSEFPFLGKIREFQDRQLNEIRMWHVKGFDNYLIFYRVTEKTLEVVRVLQGSRDITALFG